MFWPIKTRKRNSWLITWESARDDYFEDLNRPRIVSILDGRVSEKFIHDLLPVLYATEKSLMAFEKVEWAGDFERRRNFLRKEHGDIYFGGHPWLKARRVRDLAVTTVDLNNEVVSWTELVFSEDGAGRLKERRFKVKIEYGTVGEKSTIYDEA